ncbi:hypothetical protein ACS0TY_008256 [Phlomoides rotata]
MDAVSSCRIHYSPCSITIPSLPRFQSFNSNLGTRCRDFTIRRLRISYPRNKGLEQCFVAPRVSCSLENSNDGCKETELSSFSNDSQQEAVIDLKLPRRSLLVAFTCDACGERSKRLINRLAYERGLVYVQCSGCSQYHKLVDNLSLVIEYNLQDEIDSSANTDQV